MPVFFIPREKMKEQLRRFRRLIEARWFLPSLYVLTAALIFGAVFAYRVMNSDDSPTLVESEESKAATEVEEEEEEPAEDAKKAARGSATETMIWPASLQSGAVRTTGFYHEHAVEQKEKEASLIQYENSFFPHAGIDFAHPDGSTFDVLAASSGWVSRYEENPMTGKQVEITHEDGTRTVYQSLAEVQVRRGQPVKRGQVIARAGNNRLEAASGIHLHFEVLNPQGQVVNPEILLKKQ